MSKHASSLHAISLNPVNGQVFAEYPFENAADLEQSLVRTAAGFNTWRREWVSARAGVLRNMAQVLRVKVEPMAQMITAEMGKPIAQARAEIEKCALTCDWYAEHGPAMLLPEKTSVENDKARIDYLPLGPVLAVMPWNFPIWQVMRGAIPIILGGNTYVLKHAPNVMGCAYLLRDAWAEAGLPEGVFEVINVTNEGVSTAIADARITAVAVTGSVRAGSAIASQAGAQLKKCVLELGGSDAFIVLADANLDDAVKSAVVGRFQNSGQICVAAKRIIVEESLLPAFTEKFVAAVKTLRIGNPLAEDTYIGPMARYDLRDELDGQVKATLSEGASLLLGGHKIEGEGNYYAPTILADVLPGMTSFKEELFGPVASLIAARDADHAVELANDSEFGLAGSVWTADEERAREIASRMETGSVFINGYTASDARVPIGGIKKSGFGRELSHFGIREFCNVQTVWVDRR